MLPGASLDRHEVGRASAVQHASARQSAGVPLPCGMPVLGSTWEQGERQGSLVVGLLVACQVAPAMRPPKEGARAEEAAAQREVDRGDDDLPSEAIRSHQRQPRRERCARSDGGDLQSEAVRSSQKQSEAVRSSQKLSEAVRSYQKQSEAIRSYQKLSGAISMTCSRHAIETPMALDAARMSTARGERHAPGIAPGIAPG